jgi:hypothetical protein
MARLYRPSLGCLTGSAEDFSGAPHFLHRLRQLPFSVWHFGQRMIPLMTDMSVASSSSLGKHREQEHPGYTMRSLSPGAHISHWSRASRSMRLRIRDHFTHPRQDLNLQRNAP